MTKVATMTSCYRGEKYLKLFLEELPKQTAFDDIELVFNHNCPSPAEIEMINEYKSKYNNLNYTVEEELLPLYESWNKCIEESTSDYICVWNIDDLRTPNSIELMKNTLDENPDIIDDIWVEQNYTGERKDGIDYWLTLKKPYNFTRFFKF